MKAAPSPPPAPNTCYLLLIRHGATANNLADPPRLQGRGTDLGLSEQGRRQAERISHLLASVSLDAVYASPMRRAVETAEFVAQSHDVAVRTIDDITEVDVGQWENRSWVEIAREDAERYEAFMTNPERCGYHGGENLAQVRDRVVPVLDDLMRRHRGNRIAVVAHNVVNRCYVAHHLGLPMDLARSLSQDNCGVNVFRLRDDKYQLITMNANLHLPGAVS